MHKKQFSNKQKKKLRKLLHSFVNMMRKVLEFVKLVKDVFNF